jgi:serine protease AprX
MLVVSLAPSAMAEGRHPGEGRKAAAGRPNSQVKAYRLDNELTFRAAKGTNKTTRVIVELQPGAKLPPALAAYAKRNGKLGIINGHVVDLPNRLLNQMAADPAVLRMHFDRPAAKFNYRTSLTIGSKVVRDTLGLTGAGVGVAVIDSGITSWHDDLTSASNTSFPYGNQRVSVFVDFVNGQTSPYDDNGHGSHVAGIIAGNGYDSNGLKSGTAPEASLASLKVLDADGNGTISNIIAALNWVAANATTYNIKVVNMSVGAGVYESYWTDPLTLATKKITDKGITVVAAAGNMGKDTLGRLQYGAITAPGNAPWVLTVGASSTNGTLACVAVFLIRFRKATEPDLPSDNTNEAKAA